VCYQLRLRLVFPTTQDGNLRPTLRAPRPLYIAHRKQKHFFLPNLRMYSYLTNFIYQCTCLSVIPLTMAFWGSCFNISPVIQSNLRAFCGSTYVCCLLLRYVFPSVYRKYFLNLCFLYPLYVIHGSKWMMDQICFDFKLSPCSVCRV
jgi:hypothetical protein